MKRLSLAVIMALFVIDGFTAARGQATKNVLTYHNDIYRTGVYAGESILRPSNVTPGRFGKVFARRVLGQIWGQPLYVRGVPVDGQLRNVVYVATSENMIYMFDADNWTPDEQTPALKSVHLGDPARVANGNFYTIRPSNGIISTPVIDLGTPPDPSKGTLYVVAKVKEEQDKEFMFHVFALDLPTLAKSKDVTVCEKPCRANTTKPFDPSLHMNRPALLISKNHLIVAFGSGPPDNDQSIKYHGWMMSYSLPDLAQTDADVFVTTPTKDTGMGAIWQSGAGPAADDQGNIYFMTGNGSFHDPMTQPPGDLADSFVKLANRDGSLTLVDWYAPPSRDVLEGCDLDLGASGPAVIQESGKVLGAGKSGILYVLDKENMGKTKDDNAASNIDWETWRGKPDCDRRPQSGRQCFRVAENQYQYQSGMRESKEACKMGTDRSNEGFRDNWKQVVMSYPHVHGSPVVWKFRDKSANLYVWPESDFLKAYHFDGEQFLESPVGSSEPVSAAMMSMPGGILSLSWDGTNPNTGIIWASRPNPNTKHIIGGPFVSVFHDQQHFVFRDKHGAIWDAFYRKDANQWDFQEININGHPAASDVFVSVFDSADQQHFVYTDSAGYIWDSFYRRGHGWDFQPIPTYGITPVGQIFVSDFFDEQHFVFRDGAGNIWDSFYKAGQGWNFRPIDTNGHPAAGDIVGERSVYTDPYGNIVSYYVHFVYMDSTGSIWDSYYRKDEGWNTFQPVDTYGHTPAGGIFVSGFYDQQHFVFTDATGTIWDSFYKQVDHKWQCNQINPSGHPTAADARCHQIDTNGPPAASDIFVSVFGDQQHFSYIDGAGNIWDSFYRKDHGWKFQPINTNGHAPAGGSFVSAFYDQQHFVYRDAVGMLWDSFYADADHRWHFQQINGCMYSKSDDYQQDMSPDEARCNAINKIVPGYLQAFDATPRGGQLVELWNSEDQATDAVEWFAKGSPPTIADGKVFVAEFPPKPAGDWNENNAFGRLIMYSLLRK
jgi:hypothetical protein